MTNELRVESPTSSIAAVLVHLRETSVWQEDVYKDIHAHPELSFHDTKTAALRFDVLSEVRFSCVTKEEAGIDPDLS